MTSEGTQTPELRSTHVGRSDLILSLAALSVVAGLVHAGAAGSHATEHQNVAELFAAAAVFQVGWAFLVVLRPRRRWLALGALANAGMVAFWFVSKRYGISWIDGLDRPEQAQLADIVCTVLEALVFAGAGILALHPSDDEAGDPVPATARSRGSFLVPGAVTIAALLFAVPALVAPHEHQHDHADGELVAADGHTHVHTGAETATTGHSHAGSGVATGVPAADVVTEADGHHHGGPNAGATKPTAAEQARANQLVRVTVPAVQKYGDPKAAAADGFESIGDAVTGFEHYVNWSRLDDGRTLDPQAVESLVYQVVPAGNGRKLVSAMYILHSGATMVNVPDVGGPLTPWHDHQDLCWTGHKVTGLLRNGVCRPGGTFAPSSPMLHVWVEDTPCGRFAGIEGGGPSCSHSHGSSSSAGPDASSAVLHTGNHGGPNADATAPTKAERVRADELVRDVKATLVPKYDDPAAAVAAGYHSIGDAMTGFEHFVSSDYLRDDVELDPAKVESLVYRVDRATGAKTFVSAMFILKNGSTMADVPDVGGPLTPWHDHQNLCWSGRGTVAGVLVNGKCTPGGTFHGTSPMLHVWVVPNDCGPFAGIETAGPVSHGSDCAHTHATSS
ncbi:MAG: hypothetical protein U0V73_00020 [Acidimicrobiia bacterium]